MEDLINKDGREIEWVKRVLKKDVNVNKIVYVYIIDCKLGIADNTLYYKTKKCSNTSTKVGFELNR